LTALHCIPKLAESCAFCRKYFSFKVRLTERKICYRGLNIVSMTLIGVSNLGWYNLVPLYVIMGEA
jgi:hypothetical protein